ncbi:MAG: lamin tail domain-containing protein, partial [Planctomycetales bacterium]|nr:lamin tail domain-containing protein [Planctomycetales bacterium]
MRVPRSRSRSKLTGKRRLQTETLESRFVLDSTVVFNELMYHPTEGNEGLEWIELHNQLALDMDLSGWSIRDGVEFAFPAGTTVPADSYLVIAADPVAFTDATGLADVLGPYVGRLSNAGELLELVNNSGRVMDRLDYADDGDWPAGPDGSGATLAKINEDWTAGSASNWRSSEQIGGTPGEQNFVVQDLTPVSTSVIASLSTWRYDDSGTDRGTSWSDPAYDDNAWSEGRAFFVAGEEDTSTPPLGLQLLPITGDADSGIDGDKVYSHAFDFGSGDSGATINGVSFSQVRASGVDALGNFSYTVESGARA